VPIGQAFASDSDASKTGDPADGGVDTDAASTQEVRDAGVVNSGGQTEGLGVLQESVQSPAVVAGSTNQTDHS
jgi:hypothetical protein